jgi:hypothetical protein
MKTKYILLIVSISVLLASCKSKEFNKYNGTWFLTHIVINNELITSYDLDTHPLEIPNNETLPSFIDIKKNQISITYAPNKSEGLKFVFNDNKDMVILSGGSDNYNGTYEIVYDKKEKQYLNTNKYIVIELLALSSKKNHLTFYRSSTIQK